MLKHLLVRHFALIDHLEVDFEDGLTIITGETGAGKSILLGALGHILGQRADSKSVQEGARKCIIEGTFALDRYPLKPFFKDNDLDYEPLTTLRREITPAGKSRAFINDTPVSLAQLKSLGGRLVDIHSQHQSLRLNRSEFQLSVVDAVGGNSLLVNTYHRAYLQFRKLKGELEELEARQRQAKLDQDYYRFQYEELHQAALKNHEQEELEAELNELEHTESIKTNLFGALQGLNSDEGNAVELLARSRNLLDQVANHHRDLPELSERLSSVVIELEDLCQEVERLAEHTQYDPERVALVTERLDLIHRLEQKHLVNSVAELKGIMQELETRLTSIGDLDSDLDALRDELNLQRNRLNQQAEELSRQRKNAFPYLEQETARLLASVGMPHAELSVRLDILDDFSPTGKDKIAFYFSANPGEGARPLTEVASGGELSRLMLAIKAIVAQKTALPTIIFDEIDTGVSGVVADKVGDILKAMGSAMQVLSITHLPQIAGKGQQHLKVVKVVKDGVTRSNLLALNAEERVEEIARMLSGQEMTDAAIRNARELLQARS